jgi:hypothetical protein
MSNNNNLKTIINTSKKVYDKRSFLSKAFIETNTSSNDELNIVTTWYQIDVERNSKLFYQNSYSLKYDKLSQINALTKSKPKPIRNE